MSEIRVDTVSEKTSANGVSIDSVILKDGAVDVQGVSDGIILDADNDTTISADTDDQIDFKTAGEDSFIMANGGVLTLLNGTTPTINLQDGTTTKGQLIIDSFDQFKITQAADDDMILSTNDTGRLTIKNDGKFATGGEGTPDCDAGGLTLDHNANDTNILTFKNSDVAHGMTSIAETDTYATFEKTSGTEGGMFLETFSEGITNLMLFACSTSEQSTRSTSATGPVEIRGKTKSGTNASTMSGDANILIIRNHATTRFIFDSDGDFHADSSSTTFDEYDDAQLARTFDISHGRGVIESKFDKFISYNHEKLAELKLVGREEDGTPNHFINVTGMQRLHNGAIWQQYEKHQKLANAVYELAKAAVGEDKANEILEQNDVKLLN